MSPLDLKRALVELPPRRKYKRGKRNDPIEVIKLSSFDEDGAVGDESMIPINDSTVPEDEPMALEITMGEDDFVVPEVTVCEDDFLVLEVVVGEDESMVLVNEPMVPVDELMVPVAVEPVIIVINDDEDVNLVLAPGPMDVVVDVSVDVISDHSEKNVFGSVTDSSM
ncbi:hypothetical protein Dimus_011371 [Dionaea muscipula]